MASADQNPPLYEALMAVKPDGMTLNAWAVKAKVNRNIFGDIRSSGRARDDIIEKLLAAAGVTYAQFGAARATVLSEVASTGHVGVGEVRASYFGADPLPALPLLGTAMGSHYDDIADNIELVELHLGEVLEYLARPQSLANDKDAYALTILSDSMSPRFEPGERVGVSPRSPVSINDDVIVQLRGKNCDDDGIKMVLIKRLVRRSASHVELRQFNPDVTFKVASRQVVAMHKVLGRLI
jgi:hypothetical protein